MSGESATKMGRRRVSTILAWVQTRREIHAVFIWEWGGGWGGGERNVTASNSHKLLILDISMNNEIWGRDLETYKPVETEPTVFFFF